MKFSAFLLGLPLATTLVFGQAPASPAKPPAAPPAAKPAAATATDDTVVMTVGTEKITKAQFERLVETLPDQQKAMVASSPDGKRKLAEQYAEMKALVQEAKAKKMDQTPAMQTRLAMQADQVLASAAYQELGNGKPSQAAVQKYYIRTTSKNGRTSKAVTSSFALKARRSRSASTKKI